MFSDEYSARMHHSHRQSGADILAFAYGTGRKIAALEDCECSASASLSKQIADVPSHIGRRTKITMLREGVKGRQPRLIG